MDKSHKNNTVVKNIETLIRSVQTSSECLSYDSKRIKPCIDALQNIPSDDKINTMAVKDLVNRLSVADEKLSEAMCLIGDALSLLTTGHKNFKDSIK